MPETAGVPEIYADFVEIATGNMGIFLGFRAIMPFGMVSPESDESESQAEPPTPLKAVVRLTQEDAKVFAIMLRRSLKKYEDDFGPISLPDGFSEGTEPAADEW